MADAAAALAPKSRRQRHTPNLANTSLFNPEIRKLVDGDPLPLSVIDRRLRASPKYAAPAGPVMSQDEYDRYVADFRARQTAIRAVARATPALVGVSPLDPFRPGNGLLLTIDPVYMTAFGEGGNVRTTDGSHQLSALAKAVEASHPADTTPTLYAVPSESHLQ